MWRIGTGGGGRMVGFENILSASRMNTAMVVFFENRTVSESVDRERNLD